MNPRHPRLPYPLIYAVIEGKMPMEEHGGRTPTFTIMDVPEDRFQDVVDFMSEEFLDEEILFSHVKFKEDPISLEELRSYWLMVLREKTSLVAFADILDANEKPRIAGANILKVKEINEIIDIDTLYGEKLKVLCEFFWELKQNCDPFKKYNVDRFLTAFGLSVRGKYQRNGLGRAFLLAREDLCRRAFNCSLIVTSFTAHNVQKIAEEIDYESLSELDYHKYIDGNGMLPFSSLEKGKKCKYMAKKLKN